MNTPGVSKYVRVSAMTFSKMLTLLKQGPHSLDELVEGTGLGRVCCSKWVIELKREGHVYIASWGENARGWRTVAEFAWGDLPDVPRPRYTNAETRKRYLTKQRALAIGRALVGV